ncbi:glycoside hydrolase family 3 C-terminal domain-containing protein [Candidatus Poriferisocius sp.]|uniref:glycoside hydrolase family 3 protein n=1 Tax=Candidatus Poriferisocius sp. TaxID=3101276 RepID=UPI003B595CBB
MTAFDDAVSRVGAGADARAEAEALVGQMTLEEKLGCLDGDLPFWPGLRQMMVGYGSRTWPAAHVDRLGVPGLDFADGPRGCVMGPSTSFPVSMARGATFDPNLEEQVGEAIGAELRANGATFTGAVCMNLLRHLGWGRAQETYGEDPHHVGEMAAAFTRGLQRHVMAAMKHFALNSMENTRFKLDVTADERALHEVYLPHFRRVADEGVAATMSAYNSLNGQWCSQNHELLTDILREEWEWDGFVVTDFVAGLRDPVRSVQAGCNVEMPFAQQRAMTLADAVANGTLSTDDVDARVAETVTTMLRFARVYGEQPDASVVGSEPHRSLARRVAVESMVLLKNDGLLPVDPRAVTKIAVLGELATAVNMGDAGSSNVVDVPDPVTPLAGIIEAFPGAQVTHSPEDATIATDADLVVVVVGYTRHDEGEFVGGVAEIIFDITPPMDHPTLGLDPEALASDSGWDDDEEAAAGGDRTSLRLPAAHERLIEAAAARSDRVVVVVVAGSGVVVPWLDTVPAALVSWYAGVEGGRALGDVLTGTEPGGRLPFAVPRAESDLVDFEPDATEVTYDLLHGQWYLDSCGVDAHLPFGHGLSYADCAIAGATMSDDGHQVVVTVENRANRPGLAVVFAFGSVADSEHRRPERRLVGFAKVRLESQARTEVVITLDLGQLDVRIDGRWHTEDRPMVISVGLDAAHTQPVG